MKAPRVPPEPFSKMSCKPGMAYLTQEYPHGPMFCWKCDRELVWNGRTSRYNHKQQASSIPDSIKEVPVESRAIMLAHLAHRGQIRKWTSTKYVFHPLRVADRISGLGGDSGMVAAATLHDVLEDTNVTEQAILEAVGPEVLALVKELTNLSKATGAPRAERKRMDRERLAGVSKKAKLIKLVDRIDNLNEMEGAPKDFQRLYAQESLLLVEAIEDASPELAEELRVVAKRYLQGKKALSTVGSIMMPVETKSKTCKEIAERIATHLKRMESDPEINKGGHYDGHWLYCAGTYSTTKVYIRYISFHGWTPVDRHTAEGYLAWLDAGNNGRIWEWMREVRDV